MDTYLESYIQELLHINDGKKNKLIDLGAGDVSKTYVLSHNSHKNDLAEYAVGVVQKRYGKTGNTLLRGSASRGEQVIGKDVNDFEWVCADGSKDVKKLNQAIENVYSELHLKGNNPLFMCVGALSWKIPVAKDEVKDVSSPLLIFPIRLARSTATSPVYIEFVRDDAYFNPCLIAKMRQMLGGEVADGFPHPNGAGAFDEPLSLEKLGDGEEYFKAVLAYVNACREADTSNGTVFSFDKNVVAIAQYNHDELCMYYDIKRNREKIYAHPLVKRVFTENAPEGGAKGDKEPLTVLSCDSVQQDIIRRVYNGESMIIKGPPGTGKTQTIANMIAALISGNKKVLLVSKKLSALSEVNAKMPAPLRKFILPLFYETETQAAKVNPVSIKGELRDLIKSRREYKFNSSVIGKRDQFNADLYESVKFIDNYRQIMFGEGVIAGGSYYEALDICLKNDLPEVAFADADDALAVTRAQYNAMLSAVEDAASYFNGLTGSGTHPVKLCPWYGAEKCTDAEAAFEVYSRIAADAERALSDAPQVFDCTREQLEAISVNAAAAVMNSPLSDAQTLNVITSQFGDPRALESACREHLKAAEQFSPAFGGLTDTARAEEILAALDGKCADADITADGLRFIEDNINIFRGADGKLLAAENINRVTESAVKIDGLLKEANAHLAEVFKVFPESACLKLDKELLAAAEKFRQYTAESEKPSLLDFAASKAYKKLLPYATGKKDFGSVVEAVREYSLAEACAAGADALNDAAALVTGRRLTPLEIQAAVNVGARARLTGCGADKYAAMAEEISAPVAELLSSAHIDGAITVGKLLDGCRSAVAYRKLAAAVNAVTGEEREYSGTEQLKAAVRAVFGIRDIRGSAPYKHMTDGQNLAAMNALRNAPARQKAVLEGILSSLKTVGEKYFRNHYTDGGRLTYGDLAVLAKEADDRNVFSAAMSYFAVIYDGGNALPLYKFFSYFEDGAAPAASFADIFEHSFYTLAAGALMGKMGLMRNGLGKKVSQKTEKAERALNGINEANVGMIEKRCMDRLDPDDSDFAFLVSERDPAETLRSLFKKHPQAILKLKNCFIITPSTASVLFRPEEYEKFDVVIVDEASQLEPVNLLPVLFRSAQCVIVGDEWQMPPIKHFEAKNPVGRQEDGSEGFLEPEISALTMALRNHSLPAEELVCHYRSKTESLITFSQKQFYPNMRTFPSPEPMRSDLGFADIFVEDGRCDNGVNEAEARKVVAILKEHFDRYYDEKAGTLNRSVGIVAFGEKQINRIIALVERDAALLGKKNRALDNFKDVPEKLIFFKTIETVQGQETQHLVLSITYGKDKDGKTVQRFGELNRDKLGRCIFNVAVTRAQYQVTLVHSVRPMDITGENVRYIRDYIETVERYSKIGRDQFVSEIPPKGFLQSVAAFIRSLGIEEDRIVFNYGVTEGSVRMPIAVLSEDLRVAVLGIWCERAVGNKYDYFDYNMRYVRNYINCGWNIYRIGIHDWVDNAEAEREALAGALKKI